MKMRKYLIFIFTIFIILTGCQSGKTDVDSDGMKTYKSSQGDIKIPAKPQRIVADYYVGELLKLDAKLVGGDLTYKSSQWNDKLDGITDVGQSIEKITSLKPDLIVTMKPEMVEQYSAIAPTACIPYGTYNPEEIMLELAKITGTENLANDWIKSFNKEIKELDKLVDKDKTVTIADVVAKDVYLYGEHYGRAGYIIYNKLGLKGTEAGEKDYIRKDESYLLLNVEAMSKYIGDYLLVLNEDGTSKGSANALARFNKNSLWKDIPAVKNNKMFYLKSEDFWYTDPYSLDYQVEKLKEVYSEK